MATPILDGMDPNNVVYLAAVEGGGTSFTCAIGRLDTTSSTLLDIVSSTNIPSSTMPPSDTISAACEYFTKQGELYDIRALGVACFGPLGLDESDETYGCILSTTPKREWAGVNVLQPFLDVLSKNKSNTIPYRLDTDVNAPAWEEFERFNASIGEKKKIGSLAYITVGTGVGVGLVVNSKTVHGMMHPEGGHVCVSKLPDDEFDGYSWGKHCGAPYGGKCTVEGLASSVALLERLQLSDNEYENDDKNDPRAVLKDLPDDHPLWDHCANALANLCVTLSLLVSIERIVFGGGVMKRSVLVSKIQTKTRQILNGYLGKVHQLGSGRNCLDGGDQCSTDSISSINDFICTSSVGDDAGLHGALSLAKLAYFQHNTENETGVSTNSSDSIYWKSFVLGAVTAVAALLSIRVTSKNLSRGK